MQNRPYLGRLGVAVFLLSGLAGSLAIAGDDAAPEPALAIAHDDPGLAWGGCPPFLPEGCGLALLRGDPASDDSDVFLRVPGKSTLPLHWHSSAERMVLVAGELEVTYEGQGKVVLRPGMFAFGPARRNHDGYCASAEPCVLYINFQAPLDAVPVEVAADGPG